MFRVLSWIMPVMGDRQDSARFNFVVAYLA